MSEVLMYTYKMLQIPPNISIESKGRKGNEAARYLQDVVNIEAENGWEFQRIDPIGVDVRPGCFASLFGSKAEIMTYHVITFRKLKEK